MAMGEEFISLEKMCHAYPGFEGKEVMALDNIDLTINHGEFVAIIGTNGSGKSTLAKHLNALLVPTTGLCKIDGLSTAEAQNIWKIRQKVGMVFQNPDNQIVATIVEEDVAFGPENMGIPSEEIQKRVTMALEAVDMSAYRNHGPHLLSGGQKQRVAIAGVLAMQSECMVMDEPTAMLDPQGRQEVLATVCRLHRESGITLIYITHFMEEALAADRVVVMEAGRIRLKGTPAEIFCQVELLKEIGLDVPLAAELASRLRREGIKLSETIISDDELLEALCP